MLAYPFWESLFVLSTAEKASTPASARCWGPKRTAGSHARSQASGVAAARTGAGAADPGAGGVRVSCSAELIWRVCIRGQCGRSSAAYGAPGGGSCRERPQQPIEVVIVIPRSDGRSQPGSSRNVTQDYAIFGET